MRAQRPGDGHLGTDAVRWRRNLQGEIDGAAVYAAVARSEPAETYAALYEWLSAEESGHAEVWARRLRDAGAHPGAPRPTWPASLLIAATLRLGPDLIERWLAVRELRERADYDAQGDDDSRRLGGDERFHAWLLGQIARAKRSSPGMARLGNALRAAVLGVNDGLVSNVSLVMGVAGAGGDSETIRIAGIAGLLAGSLSMAMGEWLSVQSSRDLFARQAAFERARGETADHDLEALARIYRSKGRSDGEARRDAAELIARGRLDGVDTAEGVAADMGGSSSVAAITSFAMFAAGAALPLLPFVIASGTGALVASCILTAAALFVMGAAITLLTGRPTVRSGLRQLGIGLAAAAVTYGAGRLLATTVF